jgi:hypothetical protein
MQGRQPVWQPPGQQVAVQLLQLSAIPSGWDKAGFLPFPEKENN